MMVGLFDGFANFVKNIGTRRDPHSSATYIEAGIPAAAELVAAFRTTWLARRIVTAIPDDATREWRSWQAQTADITLVEKLEETLGVKRAVRQAMVLARLLGGAAIYLSFSDFGESDRLAPSGGLQKLVVLGRTSLTAEQESIQRDPDSPYYGEPEFYRLALANGLTKRIHQSRLVRFWGADVLDLPGRRDDGWSDSVLTPMMDAIKYCDSAMANTASMTYEAKTDVVKVKNLMSSMMAQPDYEATLIKRFQLAAMAKGTNGMLLLDEMDEWDQKTLNFAGLPDVIDRFFHWAAGASGIPVTRLFGRSPGGLNSTGESDMRNYYDGVREWQTNELAPELVKLDRALMGTAFGQPREDIFYNWVSLWQPTADEKAETSRKIAEVGQILIESGMLAAETAADAVTNTLIDIGAITGLEQAMKVARAIPQPPEGEDDGEL